MVQAMVLAATRGEHSTMVQCRVNLTFFCALVMKVASCQIYCIYTGPESFLVSESDVYPRIIGDRELIIHITNISVS